MMASGAIHGTSTASSDGSGQTADDNTTHYGSSVNRRRDPTRCQASTARASLAGRGGGAQRRPARGRSGVPPAVPPAGQRPARAADARPPRGQPPAAAARGGRLGAVPMGHAGGGRDVGLKFP
jgi:hypothetical protein